MSDIQKLEIEKPEIQKFANNKEIITFLADKFPKCFILEGESRPLKIGLFQDLVEALKDEPRVSKTQLRQALRQYTSNWRYLHSVKVGAIRVDLHGNDCGELTQEHIEHASQQLQESKAKVSAKRAAERAANNVVKKQKRPVVKNSDNKTSSTVKFSPRRSIQNKPPLKMVDLDLLHKGAVVKVKAGERVQNAQVLEILKDSVRVQLNTGLIVEITADRLFV